MIALKLVLRRSFGGNATKSCLANMRRGRPAGMRSMRLYRSRVTVIGSHVGGAPHEQIDAGVNTMLVSFRASARRSIAIEGPEVWMAAYPAQQMRSQPQYYGQRQGQALRAFRDVS